MEVRIVFFKKTTWFSTLYLNFFRIISIAMLVSLWLFVDNSYFQHKILYLKLIVTVYGFLLFVQGNKFFVLPNALLKFEGKKIFIVTKTKRYDIDNVELVRIIKMNSKKTKRSVYEILIKRNDGSYEFVEVYPILFEDTKKTVENNLIFYFKEKGIKYQLITRL